jgi:hypothetical protein
MKRPANAPLLELLAEWNAPCFALLNLDSARPKNESAVSGSKNASEVPDAAAPNFYCGEFDILPAPSSFVPRVPKTGFARGVEYPAHGCDRRLS